MTPFSQIMRVAVEATPGAIGGAFAAEDGETVDAFAADDQNRDEWAILTAHYGVVLRHIQSALLTRHYGAADIIILAHSDLDVLVRAVSQGYYALMAVHHPAPLGIAMRELEVAAAELRREME